MSFFAFFSLPYIWCRAGKWGKRRARGRFLYFTKSRVGYKGSFQVFLDSD